MNNFGKELRLKTRDLCNKILRNVFLTNFEAEKVPFRFPDIWYSEKLL
jgi:hypothetical protein